MVEQVTLVLALPRQAPANIEQLVDTVDTGPKHRSTQAGLQIDRGRCWTALLCETRCPSKTEELSGALAQEPPAKQADRDRHQPCGV